MTTTKTYIVTIYRTMTGRWAFRHPSGMSSNGHWATRAYAAKVAKQNGFAVRFED